MENKAKNPNENNQNFERNTQGRALKCFNFEQPNPVSMETLKEN